MSLFFNKLSRFVIDLLPRSNHFLISWLQSPSTVILELMKGNLLLLPHFPFYLSWNNGAGYHYLQLVSSIAQLCPTLCDPMDYSAPGFPVHHQLPELAQIHLHRVGDTIQPSDPVSPSPAFNLSWHQGLSSESVLCIRWPKYWCFSFSISFSNEYSGLISFRIDWFDLFAVQGTLKSLLQHHSSKASIL